MKQIFLDWRGDAFGNNTTAFPTPDPALAGLTTQANALNTKIQARDAAKAAAKALTAEVEDLSANLKGDYKKLGMYVGNTATTEAQVQAVLMSVKGKGTARPLPDRVEGLELTPGDDDGTLHSQWDPDDDAEHYELQISTDVGSPTNWLHKCTCPHSSMVLTDLPSGTKVWVRVRAQNATGNGAWSDPAVRRVP